MTPPRFETLLGYWLKNKFIYTHTLDPQAVIHENWFHDLPMQGKVWKWFWPESSFWLALGRDHVRISESTYRSGPCLPSPGSFQWCMKWLKGHFDQVRLPDRLVEMVVYAVDPASCYGDSCPRVYFLLTPFFCLWLSLCTRMSVLFMCVYATTST